MLLLCCSGGVVWHLCVQERLCLGHCASLCPPYAPVLPMLQSDVAGGAAIYRDGEPGPQARITEAYKAGDQTLEVRAGKYRKQRHALHPCGVVLVTIPCGHCVLQGWQASARMCLALLFPVAS